MTTNDHQKEWCLLQKQFDSYEKFSLMIKLVNIGLLSAAYFLNSINIFVILLLLILWMQDAIWKTFQSRIETRLLQLESYLLNNSESPSADEKAFQFNSLYQKNRPGTFTLINEYLHQAIRPTIAFPHFLLVLMSGFVLLF